MLPLAKLGSATPTLRGSQSQAISKGGRCVLCSRESSVLSDRSQDTFQHSSGAPGEQKTAQTTAALFRKDLKLLDYKQEKKVVCFRLPSGLGCSSAVWQQALKTATIPPFQKKLHSIIITLLIRRSQRVPKGSEFLVKETQNNLLFSFNYWQISFLP